MYSASIVPVLYQCLDKAYRNTKIYIQKLLVCRYYIEVSIVCQYCANAIPKHRKSLKEYNKHKLETGTMPVWHRYLHKTYKISQSVGNIFSTIIAPVLYQRLDKAYTNTKSYIHKPVIWQFYKNVSIVCQYCANAIPKHRKSLKEYNMHNLWNWHCASITPIFASNLQNCLHRQKSVQRQYCANSIPEHKKSLKEHSKYKLETRTIPALHQYFLRTSEIYTAPILCQYYTNAQVHRNTKSCIQESETP